MRILYVASAIEAGGSSGGWTHVSEVACGLASLGHEVLVFCRAGRDSVPNLGCGVRVVGTRLPQQLAFLAAPRIARIADRFRPHVVMERYYNFAGAGALVAHRRHLPLLLEVNAPMVDPPGSFKSRVDRWLLGAMRRWAVRQARGSSAIVTPLQTTVPAGVNRRKIHELPWGANVAQFDPALGADEARRRALKSQLGLEPDLPVAVFLGSFRAWHGVGQFAEAARRLVTRGSKLSFLAIGGGPELEPLKAKAAGWNLPPARLVFAGSQPHERVPELLSAADIGVAPFDISAHPPLAAFGFYWSPLKVFEYMAMALPVVTIDVTPLNEIVRHGEEGLLYKPGDIAGLVRSLDRLACDAGLRLTFGASARRRVNARYSWAAHCSALDRILREIANVR